MFTRFEEMLSRLVEELLTGINWHASNLMTKVLCPRDPSPTAACMRMRSYVEPFLFILNDPDLMRSNCDKVQNLLCQNILGTCIRAFSSAAPDDV
jgi:hypothetical protein